MDILIWRSLADEIVGKHPSFGIKSAVRSSRGRIHEYLRNVRQIRKRHFKRFDHWWHERWLLIEAFYSIWRIG